MVSAIKGKIQTAILIEILIGRTDGEAEALTLRHLIQRADSLEKTHAGKD